MSPKMHAAVVEQFGKPLELVERIMLLIFLPALRREIPRH